MQIKLSINGQKKNVEINPGDTLLKAIRRLGLTGTKEGCGEGECGACTVLLEGLPINSCLYLAFNAQGKDILTIEGLKGKNGLHPIQQAFVEEGAIQCGYCTPGMVLISKALIDRNPHPTEEEIRNSLSGNLCRCTGYVKIVNAVKRVAEGGKRNEK